MFIVCRMHEPPVLMKAYVMKSLTLLAFFSAMVLMQSCGLGQPPVPVLDRIFEAADENSDGTIDQDEAAASRFRPLRESFKRLDKDSNGKLDKKEFGEFSSGIGPRGRSTPELEKPRRPANLLEAVVTVLERNNYNGFSVDDDISARMHDLFLQNLDPTKLILLQSDIDEFQVYSTQHDDLLKQSDLSAADAILARYRERVRERMRWASELSKAGFDFEKVETRTTKPDARHYAMTQEESKEQWRKEIKFQLITRIAAAAPQT